MLENSKTGTETTRFVSEYEQQRGRGGKVRGKPGPRLPCPRTCFAGGPEFSRKKLERAKSKALTIDDVGGSGEISGIIHKGDQRGARVDQLSVRRPSIVRRDRLLG